jgi:hypothetical protein
LNQKIFCFFLIFKMEYEQDLIFNLIVVPERTRAKLTKAFIALNKILKSKDIKLNDIFSNTDSFMIGAVFSGGPRPSKDDIKFMRFAVAKVRIYLSTTEEMKEYIETLNL